jgi:type IV pilus assembly protein PilY1
MSMVMNVQRPVTAEGSVSTDEYNHLWVYFGTGRLYSEFDIADTTTQQMYLGFRDDTVHTTDPLQLYNATNVNIDTLGNVLLGASVITFDSLKTLVDSRLGWYRWLRAGERTLTSTLVMGGAVLFTTFRPTEDICSYGGTAKLYALYYQTGTAYSEPFLGATGNINNISLDLGSGMPSEPALYVTADQTKVFIQVGGVIVSPQTGIPGLPRGGVILWKGR